MVYDQTVTDNSILVASVTIDTPGWVVIHNNLNGIACGMIGFAPVNAGTSTNISVPIDPKIATTTLFAVLNRDIGKQGCFEYPGPDVPVIGSNGMQVMASFRVNLPEQGALGQTTGLIGTNEPITAVGQAVPGTAVQPIVISYGAPSSNISNAGVFQLGSGTTETGPLAINTTSTAGNLAA